MAKKVTATDTIDVVINKPTVEQMDNIATAYGKDDDIGLTPEEQHQQSIRQVIRLRLKGLSVTDTAKFLDIGYNRTKELITEGNAHMRNEVKDFDYPLFIGESMEFFNEVRNTNMALANSTQVSNPAAKALLMRTAMQAEVNKHNLLAKVGLFQQKPSDSAFEEKPQKEIETDTTDADDFNSFLEDIAMATASEKKKTKLLN